MIHRLRALWLALAICFAAAAQTSLAHEVRPAYLAAEETAPGEWRVTWKQPVLEGKRLKLDPIFLEAKEGGQSPCPWVPETRENLASTTIERGRLQCQLEAVRIDGLERTLTDTIAEIRPAGKAALTALLRPDRRSIDLSEPDGAGASLYLAIGIEHIVFGWDHLLFVIALVILIGQWRRVVGVITAFTLAHSVTLGLAALGFVGIPSRPVEILIEASIVLLGWEILRKQAGEASLVTERPYLVAIVVGLIHGLGFAGALAEIGLPKGTELMALLLFNIGVELGQIAVILAVLAALWALGKAAYAWQASVIKIAAYCLGAIGMFWMIERLAQYWA